MSTLPNSQQPSSTIFCTNCGSQQAADQKFCAECGKPLNQTAPVAISQPAVTQTPPQANQTSYSNQFWSWFRRQRAMVQVLGWLFFYWILIPVLIWRAPWSKAVRITILSLLAFCFLVVGATNSNSGQQRSTASSNTTNPRQVVAVAPTSGAGDKPTAMPAPTSVPESAPAVTNAPVPTATVVPTTIPTVEPTKAPEPTPVPPTAEPTKEILPKIGDQVDVDEVSWRVEDAIEAGDTIKSDNQFVDPLVTAGKFIRVRVALQNQGTDQRHVSARDMEVVDAQGRTYKASDAFAVAMIVGSDNACTFQELPAGVPKLCRLIFEVPKDASGFRFKATNLALLFTEEKLIDLGL